MNTNDRCVEELLGIAVTDMGTSGAFQSRSVRDADGSNAGFAEHARGTWHVAGSPRAQHPLVQGTDA